MSAAKNKLGIWRAVIGGIVAILVVIFLGKSHVSENGNYYVTYFDESVQGLEEDSPVKYRGVTIGRVHEICVAPDSKIIEVVLEIKHRLILVTDTVAQLKPESIKGNMFIDLDQKKKEELDRSPLLCFPSVYPIISSRPSKAKRVSEGGS